MKKLGKLEINPEKVISNKELMALKGGYSHWDCLFTCNEYPEWQDELIFDSTCDYMDFQCAEMECYMFWYSQCHNGDCVCGLR